MNKKLFALLTSAALMAGFAPSVFAADAGKEATLKFEGPATVAAGEEAEFDVIVNANTKLDTIQFAFVAEGAEVQDFKMNSKVIKSLGFDDKGFKGKMSEQDKIDYPDNEDYQFMAFDQDFESTYVDGEDEEGNEIRKELVAPTDVKLGTLKVKVADDATAVTVTTSDMKKGAGATGVANYEVDKFATWTTVAATATVGDAESSSEEEPDSSSKPEPSSSESSKADSSSNSESKKDDSASSSSSSSSKNDSKSSSKATNGTTSNTNTGAASTAAVALAAAAAAMVVISKKRK